VSISIDPKTRRIQVTLVGEVVKKNTLIEMAARLPEAGLPQSELKVFQTGEQYIDVAALKSNLLGDLYKASQVEIAKKIETIEKLRLDIALIGEKQTRFHNIPQELHILYPPIVNVNVSETPEWNDKTGWSKTNVVIIGIQSIAPLRKSDQMRIEKWASARLKSESVKIMLEIIKK
jgi:hypothetical protein